MTTAYTSLLGLALPVTGELSGTWGDTVNTAITSLLDTAIAGTTSITTDADITLSTTTGASNQARQAIILWNPASGTTTRNITAPAQSKMYVVINASGGTQSIVIRGAGPTTGVTIAKGESATVAWNGSDFVKVSSSGGAITFTDLTVTGNTILGDAAADTLTVNATSTFASPVNFQGLVKLPSTGRSAAAALTVTAPAFLYGVASTYTDTTSSGTIAAMAPFYALSAPTLSTSNVTTYTSAATLYIANAPAAGGSATITNPYALYIAAGNMYFGGSVASNLLFVDNTYDIGASGATRPRNLFLSGNATVGGNTTLGDAAADTVTVNGTITSNLLFTDNTYDIGASGATRPRNYYGSGTLTIGGNATVNGTALDINPASGNPNISLRSGSTYRGYIEGNSTGMLFGTGPSATTAITILNNQYVGLATSPSNRLTVYEPSANPLRLIQDHGTSNAYGIEFYTNAGGTPYTVATILASHGGAYTNSYMQFQTATTARALRNAMHIDARQYIQLGSSTPAYPVDIYGSYASTFVARILNQSGSTSSDNGLLVETSTASVARTISIRNSGSETFSVTGTGITTIGGTGNSFNSSLKAQIYNGLLIGYGLYTYATVETSSAADLILTTNANPANLGVNSKITFKSGNSGGGGPSERARIDVTGLVVQDVGTFGRQDYTYQTTQKVLVLNGDPVSGAYTANEWRYYTYPGESNIPQMRLGIRAYSVAGGESADLLNINATGAVALRSASTGADGTGIVFPATQNASTNANTLDDYEEGTWTVGLRGASTSGTYVLTATGKYTKIGNVVNVQATISAITVSSAGTGYAQITGLPFTKTDNSLPQGAVYFNSVTFASLTDYVTWSPISESATAIWYFPCIRNGLASANQDITGFTSASSAYFSATYLTS
jgi:hypothetical protein